MATEVAVTLAKLQGRVGPMSDVYKVEMYKVPLTTKSLIFLLVNGKKV